MPVGIVVLFLALVIPFVLWLAISRETSNPTVVDRAEAERIAKERGGRRRGRSSGDSSDRTSTDGRDAVGWGDRASSADAAHIEEDGRTDDDGWSTRREY